MKHSQKPTAFLAPKSKHLEIEGQALGLVVSDSPLTASVAVKLANSCTLHGQYITFQISLLL